MLYLFTRRSIHQGRFNQRGVLIVRELDQVTQGQSVSVGALDDNVIWVDDQNNIMFKGEQGECMIDGTDRVKFIAKRKMLDEWKDVNDREPVHSFKSKTWTTQADWGLGTVGSNLNNGDVTEPGGVPGLLTYKYPKKSGQSVLLSNFSGSPSAAQRVGYTTGYPSLGASNTWTIIPAGASIYFLTVATLDIRIDNVSLGCNAFNPPSDIVTSFQASILKYKYEAGRTATFALADTSKLGLTAETTPTSAAITALGFNPVNEVTLTLNNPVYIPQGEYFWTQIRNSGGEPLIIHHSPESGTASPTAWGSPGVTLRAMNHGTGIVADPGVTRPTTSYFANAVALGYRVMLSHTAPSYTRPARP